jgi:predicted 3-demethylubiquinone-9 3-methyltransferase (glyoxalase superfamily)
MLSKNTICLWFDGTALEAAQFYARDISGQRGGNDPAGAR